MGRFINADGQFNNGLLGNNLFAYCENNPVMRIDPTGQGWIAALIAVVCIVVVVSYHTYKTAKRIQTIAEMYNSFSNMQKAKYVVASEIFNVAANPNHWIDTSHVLGKYKESYKQNIKNTAEIIRTYSSTFKKMKAKKIKSFGALSKQEADDFIAENEILYNRIVYTYLLDNLVKFVEKGTDIILSDTRWSE